MGGLYRLSVAILGIAAGLGRERTVELHRWLASRDIPEGVGEIYDQIQQGISEVRNG